MRKIIAALALLALPADAQVLTTVELKGAATPEGMAERLNKRAKEIVASYPAGTAVARSAQIHGTYPDGAAEIAAMGGNGIVLLAIVTHDPAELPLKRAFFRNSAGVETVLTSIGYVAQPVAPDSTIHALYGDHRQDNFFLLPLAMWAGGGTLFADFAVTRSDFKIIEFPAEAPGDWQPGMASGGTPQPGALAAMLRREYPGYALPATAQ